MTTMNTTPRKTLSIVTGSYNEEGNVDAWFERVLAVCETMTAQIIEIIWIDNASTDGTAAKVLPWCLKDKRVKLIVNARNFGPIRSPFHGMMQSSGDACIYLASDLQDSPEIIPEFVAKWQEGFEVVAGVYERSPDGLLMRTCRKTYYALMTTISETQPMVTGFTGFGLYTRRVLDFMRRTGGPTPFVRALVLDMGHPIAEVRYEKPPRSFGFTKNSLLGLIDQAILSLTTMSKAPIRFATITGLMMSGLGFFVAFAYLVAKLLFWTSFPLGQAPLLIGIFLFTSVQILIMGLIGEYVSAIHMRLQNKPWVVEKLRVNFDDAPSAEHGQS